MQKNIVVLGGGFGGLRAALTLAHELKVTRLLDHYQVILVDRHEYHTYTPLLYKVAVPPVHPGGLVDEDRAVRRFKDILGKRPVRFVQGEAAELDLARGDIHLARGEELLCDYLVLAPGSETNYFNIPGLKENSLALKTFADAKKIQTALSELFAKNPKAKILLGGGGPTGVEVAGEIKYNYPRAQVMIVEAAPTLLPGFNPRILANAAERLRWLGVIVTTNEAIAEVARGKAITKSKRTIPFDLLIWTGGVKAPDFIKTLPLKTEARGRVEVRPEMLCLPQNPDLKLGPMVYALGDSVCVYDPKTGKPLPGVAPAAIEQGIVAAENILDDIQEAEGLKHKTRRATYHAKDHPYVLTVGGRWAVAKMGPAVFTGLPAWLFGKAAEVDYRLSIRF